MPCSQADTRRLNRFAPGDVGSIVLAVPSTLKLVVLLGTTLALPSASWAQQAEDRTAFEAGARAGVSYPLGNSISGKALSDQVGPSFPLTFELGVRLLGRYELALVGQYALGTISSTNASGCYTGNNACSSSVGQLGLEFLYHPLGLVKVDPFVGVGFGYEWLIARATISGKNNDLAVSGWNWVVLQTGVEFGVSSFFRVGPYALLSIGQYQNSSYTVIIGGVPQSGTSSIANPAVHLWLSVGIRLVLMP